MSAIQVRQNNDNEPFVLDDSAEVIDGITLAAEQGDLTIGAVLGEVTATPGTYKLVACDASDGSQMPKLILATADVDSDGSATENLSAYTAGLFDENQLVFSGTTVLATRLELSSDGSLDASMRDILRMFNLRVAPTLSVSGFENPVL